MKVLITGTYHLGDINLIDDVVNESGFFITSIINGGGPGIETAALDWARVHDIPADNLDVNRIKYTIPNIRKDKYIVSKAEAGIFIIRPFVPILELGGGEVHFLLSEMRWRGRPHFRYIVRTPYVDHRLMFPAGEDNELKYRKSQEAAEKEPEKEKKKEHDLFGEV